jgi:hypothetical protein
MGKEEKIKERLPKLPDFNKRIISHSVDSMTQDAIEKIKREHPNMREHVKQIEKARGAGMESAIMSEQVFNHILAYMGYELTKLLRLNYGEKIKKIIKILEENTSEDKWRSDTVANLKKIRCLRNIYAHVPADYSSDMPTFDTSEEYYSKEDQEFRFKSLKELNIIFEEISKDLCLKRVVEILKRLIPIREKEKGGDYLNPICVRCGKVIFGSVYAVEDKSLEKNELVFHNSCFDKDYISDYIKEKEKK